MIRDPNTRKTPLFVSLSFLSEVEAEGGSLLNATHNLIKATEHEDREKALNDLRNIIIDKE